MAKHNLPLQVNHATKLFKIIFPSSKIAKKFACGHTKTAAITRALLLVQTLSVNIYKNSKYYNVKHVGITELNSFKIINILHLANTSIVAVLVFKADNTNRKIIVPELKMHRTFSSKSSKSSQQSSKTYS